MNKFKNFFKHIWNNIIIPRYNRYKNRNDFETKIRDIRKDFEKRFNVKVDDIKEVMYHERVKTVNDEYEKQLHLNEELIKGKVHVMSIHKYVSRTPFLYDPDVVDIHNENYHNNRFTLSDILKKDSENTKNSLKQQAKKHGGLFIGDTNTFTTTLTRAPKKKTIEDLNLSEIIEIKAGEEIKRLQEMEKELKAMNVAKMFEDEPMDGVKFPKDINIDDYPTIKKILGKDKNKLIV